jgi:hypothetical protein
MNFVALVVLLLLAACQPLPHPFAHDTPPPNSPILTPPDSAGIVVEPVAGAPEPAAHDLAAAMAKALQDNDVPASTGASNRGSFRLSGDASAVPAADGNLLVTIAWSMRDASGATVSRQESQLSVPNAAWSQGGGDVAKRLASPAAPSLAKMVQTTAPAPLAGTETLIAVRSVTGAPGDGGEALARAMGDALRRANLTLAERTGPAPTFLVQGKVELSPPANGKQQIKIAWALLRPDGGQIGQVQQENAIPAGSLDGSWGLTAYDVANAAAPGIAALIAESKRVGAKS